LEVCELHELKSAGAYFSWTNKTIWSHIDHVFLNDLWYDSFDYTHSCYLANGLSDHTPIILQFPTLPKPSLVFQYCDMWSKHKDFPGITTVQGFKSLSSPMLSLCKYLNHIRNPLRRLHKEHFADLKNQQLRARRNLELIQLEYQNHPGDSLKATQKKEAGERSISILSSSIDLIRQQGKLEWIKYGDDSTRLSTPKPSKESSHPTSIHL